MPAWSDAYGGPLRDQGSEILNWRLLEQVEPLPTPTPSAEELADPVARGQKVFLDSGCSGCHTIQGLSTGTVGPNLSQIATVAATRVPGISAEDYIRESILDPSVFVVEGFPDNVMPKNFSTLLSQEKLEDLIAFLVAQK
jgi:cytochrome c2